MNKSLNTNFTSTHETLEEEEDGFDPNWEVEKPAEKNLQLSLKLSQKFLTKLGPKLSRKLQQSNIQ